MREQETVLRLKAKNQTLAIELSSLTGKVKDLSTKITETRAGVAAVKTTIDGIYLIRFVQILFPKLGFLYSCLLSDFGPNILSKRSSNQIGLS